MALDPSKPAQDQAFESGDVIANRYRVISLLGQGGMGIVYKVEQLQLGKEFALKTVLNSAITDANIRRFQSEAKAYYAVNHPNIISVHDFGLLNDNTPFLVMELLNGKTLGEQLKNGALPVKTTLQIFSQVCQGLAHAHGHGIIHRDLKPGNIMLMAKESPDTAYSVKILDFGIAKLAQSENGEIQALTRTGEIFGSPLYMSPEQCSGEKIDARSDIYSLGCVLFETLTGTPPFVGENALSTMIMHQNTATPTLKEASLGADYPRELEAILSRMLEKDPVRRYQSVEDVSRHLAILLSENKSNKEQLAVELSATSHRVLDTKSTVTLRKTSFLSLLSAVIALSGLAGYATASIAPPTSVKKLDVAILEETTHFSSDDKDSLKRARQSQSTKIDVLGTISDKDLQIFRGYQKAQSVSLIGLPVTNVGLANLSSSNIIEFNLDSTKIKSVENIVNQPFLQRLNLSSTSISDNEIEKLMNLKMLYVLDITDTEISEHGLRKVLASHSLHNVVLDPKKFSSTFLDEMANRMPQCAFGAADSQSNLDVLKGKLHGMTAVEKFPILISLASKGSKENSEVGYLNYEYGCINLERKKLSQAKLLADIAEKIFSQNGNQVGLCKALCLQARCAAYEKRYKDYDELVGQAAKYLFQCYRYDKSDTWILFRSLVNAPAGIKHLENTIAAEEKAEQILSVGADCREYLPQISQQLNFHRFETNQSARELPNARKNL